MNRIEIQLTKDIIRDKSFNSVDKAIKIIKAFGSQDRFIVLGAKDSSGTAIFNNNLSKSRVDAVVKFIVNEGVPTSILTA